MKKTVFRLVPLVLMVAALLFIQHGCTDRSANNTPDNGNIVINPSINTPKLLQYVNLFRLTVSGRDMETIVDTLDFDGRYIYGEVRVPVGGERLFVLEAIDVAPFSEEVVIYRGETRASVALDADIELNIAMIPVVPLVKFTPRLTEVQAGEEFELDIEVFNIPGLGGMSIVLWSPQQLAVPINAYPSETITDSLYFDARPVADNIRYQVFIGSAEQTEIVDANGNGTLATVQFASEAFTGTDVLDDIRFYTIQAYNAMLDTLPMGEPIRFDEAQVNIIALPNDDVTFTDPDLERAVRDALQIPETESIVRYRALQLEYLQAVEYGVTDLGGIEHLANLRDLEIGWGGGAVTNLAPVSQLYKLQRLYLEGCQLVNIAPLAPLVGLTELHLYWNDIVDISPLAGLTNMVRLDLRDNAIVNIDALQNMGKIHWLDLSNNDIRSLYPLVLNPGMGYGDTVDVLGNRNLDSLSINEYMPALENRGVTFIVPM